MYSSKKIAFIVLVLLNLSVFGIISFEAYQTIQTLKNRGCYPGIYCFNDYHEGLAYAQKVNKPIFLVFTGHAIVSDRKFEKLLLEDRTSKELINKNFVLITLYVDELKPTWDSRDWVSLKYNDETKIIKSNGAKWFYFQAENFGQVSQPWFVLLSPDERLLNKPRGNSSGETYVQEMNQFLKCGIVAFNSIK